jgi:hypothetical protein
MPGIQPWFDARSTKATGDLLDRRFVGAVVAEEDEALRAYWFLPSTKSWSRLRRLLLRG